MCYFCGHKFDGDKVYRSTVCTQCGHELRSCVNCRFYDSGAHWECRETISEAVADKENANFCEFFSYEDKAGHNSGSDKAKAARNAFLRLFGD